MPKYELQSCKLCNAPAPVRERIERRLIQGNCGGFEGVSKWISRQPEFCGLTISKSSLHRHMREHTKHRDAQVAVFWPDNSMTVNGKPVSGLELQPQDIALVVTCDEIPAEVKAHAAAYTGASVIASTQTEKRLLADALPAAVPTEPSQTKSDGKYQKS